MATPRYSLTHSTIAAEPPENRRAEGGGGLFAALSHELHRTCFAPLPDPASKEPIVSVMTKLFVVLLIICSLLLTAATVVFVNRTEDFHKAATLSEERANRFQRDKEAAQRDADAARTRETEAIATANGKVSDYQARIQQMTQDLAAKDAQVNELNAKLAVNQGT